MEICKGLERLDLIMPGQQQGLLLPLWNQDKIIILKEYAPLGAKALILVERSYKGPPCFFILIKRTSAFDFFLSS